MKVLVTGGTGHLGAWLVKALAEAGHSVIVICRNPGSVGYLNFPGVQLAKGDIMDVASLDNAMDGVTHVYHLAAFAEVWAKDKSLFHQLNVIGTQNVLDSAFKAGVSKVVATSSAGNFGPSLEEIITETSTRKEPFYTLYEETKHAADLLTLEYVNKGMDIVIVYPTRVYGPVLSGKPASLTLLLSKMKKDKFRMVPGAGLKLGNYAFIEDVTRGFLLAMEKGKSGEKYILGGENHSLLDFYKMGFEVMRTNKKMLHVPLPLLKLIVHAQALGTLFGKKPTLTNDWLKKILLDWEINIDKAKTELGYTVTPLQVGIEKTLNSLP